MKKKKITVKKEKGGHLRHMGHSVDDMTMIIIAGGAFVVMVLVAILTGNIVLQHQTTSVTKVNASSSGY